VLVIATDVPAALPRPGVYRGILHETRDQTAMFAPVTKSASLVEAGAEIGGAVLNGAQQALAAPSGPVYLGIPTDLLHQPAPSLPQDAASPSSTRPFVGAGLDVALELLAGAARPLIWAGGGALRANAGAAVGALADKLAAPVLTTYMGRGLLPPEHPWAVAGPAHAAEVGALWDDADVVLAVGTDFDAMMTQNWLMPRPPRLVSVNVDAADANKNYESDVTLVGDAREVVEELLARVRDRATAPRSCSPGCGR
jgi:thiamine pyrophosphate-dependent acetolactate synthase large subunit-like protein